MEQPEVMVYLMTGFLDSGKSQFLKIYTGAGLFSGRRNNASSLM